MSFRIILWKISCNIFKKIITLWSHFVIYKITQTQVYCLIFLIEVFLFHPLRWRSIYWLSYEEAGYALTHFRPMFPFYNPWKHQKTFGFRGHKMGKPEMGKLCKTTIRWYLLYSAIISHMYQDHFFNNVYKNVKNIRFSN